VSVAEAWLNQYVHYRYHEREPGEQVVPTPMHDVFEVADQGHHGQHGFDQHPVIPLPRKTGSENGVRENAGKTGSEKENGIREH
jgi:hypothetical protein